MMRHKNSPVTRSLVVALLSFTALVSPAQANVPIVDTSGLAELKTQVQTTLNQLNELTEMKKLAEEQLSTIGKFGSLGNLFDGTSFSNIGSESDFYTNMENFAFDPCAINLCQTGDNPVGTTDIEEAREWAMKSLFAGTDLDGFQERDLNEVRRRAVVYSATNGVALATITHNDLAGAKEQSDALEQIVEASEDLRGDVRANSAIALAAYKVELQQLAMLTAMLGVQASDAIYNSSSLYHEDGGEEFPDAYIESDYAVNDRTIRFQVTVPEQGSGSGSGFGGSLIQSITGGNSSVSDILSSATGGSPAIDSVDGLVNAIQSGDLPALDADTLRLSSLVVDAAEIAMVALGDDAPEELSSALSQIRTGLSENTSDGMAKAVLGVAQTYASASDNDVLSAALNTASSVIAKGDKQGAIDFAKGVARDLANSASSDTADYLLRQVALVEAGGGSVENLVLDAAAIYSAYGSSSDSDVAQMLSVDLAGVDDAFFKDLMVSALDHIAEESGQSGVSDVADVLRSLSDEDLEALRSSLKAAEASAGQTTAANDQDEIFQ